MQVEGYRVSTAVSMPMCTDVLGMSVRADIPHSGPQHPEGSSCPPRLPTKGEPLAFALLGTGPLAAQKPSYSSGTTESHPLLGLPSLQGAHARREAKLGPGVLRASPWVVHAAAPH